MVLATRKGLAYVLRERKMAFPPTRPIGLHVGDQLLIYTSRGIYNNPGRDRGRIVGTAEIVSPIVPLDEARLISGRLYTSGCDLNLTGLAPLDEGIELANIADQLAVFQPNPAAWSARLRRSILPLPFSDVELVMARLKPILRNADETMAAYIDRAELFSPPSQ